MTDCHQYCTGGFSPDDIVISGIGGRIPMCNSLEDFNQALLTKRNLLEENDDRFEKGAENVLVRNSGTLGNLSKFDSQFFGIPASVAADTDVLQRMMLEVSYEAILDSGYDLQELDGKDIGVYNAVIYQDERDVCFNDGSKRDFFPLTFLRAMYPNKCSYYFNFKGPSYSVDSACSSSFVALHAAFNDIREGRVEAAIVNGGQLCMHPVITSMYARAGILSLNNRCCPFDAKADGFVRTEAVTALFIQKASVARRAYATLLDIQQQSGGYEPKGISVPPLKEEIKLMNKVLKRTGLSVDDISYVEAHGTGTPVGDPIEVKAIETVFCSERRIKPLYIGSVKSNVGHSEASAGHVATIKILLAFETGLIAPNFNYETPNPNCEALVNGTIQVLTEPTAVESPYVLINSFGFGGTILTAILKRNPIEIARRADDSFLGLPRLVLYPATTEAAVQKVLKYVQDDPELEPEFFALLNKLSFDSPNRKSFRGYALIEKESTTQNIKHCQSEKKRELWFVMTGMGCQWPGMGLEMMKISVFAESMKKSASVLGPLGVDLFEILKRDSKLLVTGKQITPAFCAIAAIQIALVDVLRALKIEPDGILGHSVGELICAYADGCCTAQQTILSAYWRGKSVDDTKFPAGGMAAVGLSWGEATQRCPEGVYPACNNTSDSVTISGLKAPLEKFVAELQSENVFARVVNTYGYAFHSKHIWPAAEKLKNSLLKVITEPKPRTARWISTSYPIEEWAKEGCKLAGPEYFKHNLMSTVHFNEMLEKVPSDAITIEIGPHFLLQSILKRSLGADASSYGLMKRNEDNNVGFFMNTIGKLYTEGLNPVIENIYPPVKFPVPRGIPKICDLMEWNHSHSHAVQKWEPYSGSYIRTFYLRKKDNYLLDHFVDGRALFPATGYIFLAWIALAKELRKNFEEMDVVVEDFKIHQATILNPLGDVSFNVTVFRKSGKFEVLNGKSLVASGNVYEASDIMFTEPEPDLSKTDDATFISGEDIYNELRILGYEYGPAFRRLLEADIEGTKGFVEWNDWISFMDALLLFYMFAEKSREFALPVGALRFKICPSVLKQSIEECRRLNLPGLPVNFYSDTKTCRTSGVEIIRLDVDFVQQRLRKDDCILEEYKFIPYSHAYIDPESEDELSKYRQACNMMVNKLETALGLDLQIGKFQQKQELNFDVDSYVQSFADHKSILGTLLCLSDLDFTSDANQRNNVSIFLESISKDDLNSALANDYCLRVMFDVILENSFRKLNVLEIGNGLRPLLPKVVEGIEKYSLSKFKSKVLVCDEKDVEEASLEGCHIQHISREKLDSSVQDQSQGVIISSFLTGTKEEATELINLLKLKIEENGFILFFHKNRLLPPEKLIATLLNESVKIVQDHELEKMFEQEDLVIISKISDNLCGNLYLLRYRVSMNPVKFIRVSDDLKFFDELKSNSEFAGDLWLVSDSPHSGIIGMVNCLLREPGGDKIRCVWVADRKAVVPRFNIDEPFFKSLLKADLVMSVHKDGVWGSYRHVRIKKEPKEKELDYSNANLKKVGDLSSFHWVESPLKYSNEPEKTVCHIYYSAINFKDVMLATGKISKMTATTVAAPNSCLLGFEFSGRTSEGRRVCGVLDSGCMSTARKVHPYLLIDVPDHWSLQEAATVPVVYITCYYAMIIRGRLKPGESILIHSGTGGIGLAAINIALSMNCEVFTTVGNEEKREYLQRTFPCLKSKNIGCSRNTSFEIMIKKRTQGRGVDMVLNSLAEEKFRASVRCVAQHGRFIEIGMYDLAMDHALGLKFFLKNISFHGVFLDRLFDLSDSSVATFRECLQMLKEGIRKGVVKPLTQTVFPRSDVEKAFRFMASGRHIGKVLLKIRDEEKNRNAIPKLLRILATPVTYFYANKVYIVVGGLGGFGIEVSKWILSRGAKNLVLTSRYGARTPYHHLCLKKWKDGGYNVVVSTKDVSKEEDASKLLQEVSSCGPVGGIFNSAVVLHDAFLDNLTLDKFNAVCAPKADATRYLDVLSRVLCPELDHFVCFSSISCGRGNAGQMNYGYANSIMERICEQRQADGLPGIAIQWGIIGDVGVVHRHMGDDAMIAGVGAQRVLSCLDILDKASQLRRPVVSSFVLKDPSRKKGEQGNPLQKLARIFGLNDVAEFNAMRSFSEMGVDSLIGIEIKHLLETSLDTTFTVKEIQELKIDDVKALLEAKEKEKNESVTELVSTACTGLPKSSVHEQPIIQLNNRSEGSPIFILDIDCTDITALKILGDGLDNPVFALLWTKDTPTSNVECIASWYLTKLNEAYPGPCHIITISTASVLAFEMLYQDQKSTRNVQSLTILNGCSFLVKAASREIQTKLTDADILYDFVTKYITTPGHKLKQKISEASSLDSQLRIVVDLFTKLSSEVVNKADLTEIITTHVRRVQVIEGYALQEKVNKDLLFVEDSLKLLANDIAEANMILKEVCGGKLSFQRIPDMDVLNKESIKTFLSVEYFKSIVHID